MMAVVDVEQPMSPKMLDALVRYEAFCICDGVTTVTDAQAREWLAQRFSPELAAEFRPEFLFSTQES